jgi:methionyl-tRNA formyltransferase
VPTDVPVLRTHSPNAPEVEAFLKRVSPDVAVALLKSIIKESVFTVPAHGTWVWHPGVCPEYRNAHGCFWALANGDVGNVGLTLLRIDRGVDTGPTYGYFTYDYDEVRESHVVIQNRVALDNLDAILERMADVVSGRAAPIDVGGRRSAVWGQPWLTSYLRWKRAARKRRRAARGRQHEEGARAGARAAVS